MHSISILIATYNRAGALKETLHAMSQVDRAGLDVQWVVIDNNSSDETAEVLRSFEEQLPLKALFEPKPGKNNALNKALREVVLQEIVVFTDDDISPAKDWLLEIVRSCERQPECRVFGGKIMLRWPQREPEWLGNSWLRSAGFMEHDLGSEQKTYPSGIFPFGGNLWMRREILEQGRLFLGEMGPMKNTRIMGSETSFLMPLAESGERMLYYPKALVEHRVKPSDSKTRVLCRKAYSMGRGGVRLKGIHHQDLLRRWPAIWHLRQRAKVLFGLWMLVLSQCCLKKQIRLERLCRASAFFGHLAETQKMLRTQTAEAMPQAATRPAMKLR